MSESAAVLKVAPQTRSDQRVVVSTTKLCKRFGSFTAVDDLSLTVYEGDLYGFLGPNGAGKTTTIRMLLGLLRPQSGSMSILGKPFPKHALEILAQVGALVESPAFYPYLTGRRNLEVFGRLSGGIEPARIDELLKIVGLSGRGYDLARTYSHGMKQRLGIAQALLVDPKLLLLDEPTNGLDPPGIVEMRALLKRLAKDHGVTIVVSSHLLHEIEMLCNRVAILQRGRLLVEGHVADLLASGRGRVELEVGDLDRARTLLAEADYTLAAEEANGFLVVSCARTAVPAVVELLVGQGIDVFAVRPRRPSLEEFFRDLVSTNADAVEPKP